MAQPPPVQPRAPSPKPDFATIGGLTLAVGGILGGLLLEGGKIKDVAQITAALIVFGGTLGAVLVTTPLAVLKRAARKLHLVFFETVVSPDQAIEEIIRFATKARRHGIVSLEQDADAVADDFLRKSLNLAVDGTDLEAIRRMMELEISLEEHHGEAEARVFEAAGGYSPTVGIIGAVLGLIQVMKHLENIEEVGRGIAVAFVATVYGVAAANLFFLPAANKLRARLNRAVQNRELMLEGVVAIVEGLNPKLIRIKLEAYAREAAAPAPANRRVRPEDRETLATGAETTGL
ncbi:MAG TPA: flagellar motor protein [Bryobacteraceae bacterium]|nr:flagellar motor protein [Bryobacteraceae bacterium]